MSRRWYGSLDNRLEEGRQFVNEIKVGTGVTEYFWSDREAYEVVEVKDQKHIVVRQYDHRHVGDGEMDNRWELISNPENSERVLEKRGDVWYWTTTVTAEDIVRAETDIQFQWDLAMAGFDMEVIKAKGKQTKRRKANISVGRADYYYDYSF